jgi:hypothetical protein
MDVDKEVQPKVEMAWKIHVAAPTAGRHRWLPMGGSCPWGQQSLSLFFLDLVLLWRRFYPSLAAAKEEDFRHNRWMPPKIGFALNI